MRRLIGSGAVALGAVLVALGLAEAVLRIGGFSFQPYPHFFEIGAVDAAGAPRGVAKGVSSGVFVPDRD
ncbi:MAG: hypothetical protein HKN12_02335, partial [Gemmatimonadetes bacterium]|nr:hypothetical protein [Gemmatimonadota bacterium]